nr:protein FAM173B [Onthophagus taurus]
MNFEDNFESNSPKNASISKTGKIFIAITGGVATGLTILCAPFVIPALRKVCLPYVPATTHQITNVLKALKGRRGNLIDLGSGDGRIVIEAAKNDFISHGVELNPWLVVYSQIDSFRRGLRAKTNFFCKDLWKFDIGKYENVVIFGVEEMMGMLEEKIRNECGDGCFIIACRFPLVNLKPKRIIGSGIDTVWVYEINKNDC